MPAPSPLYNVNTPTGTTKLSVDWLNLRNNTMAANTSFGINHFAFNNATDNNGKHKYVDMVSQALPSIAVGDGAIYVNTNASSVTNLYYTPDNSGNTYQITRTNAGNYPKFSNNIPYGTPPAGFDQEGGWTFLPGGMLLQYGFYGMSGATGTSGNIQFPFTFTNPPYSVQISVYQSNLLFGNNFVAISSTNPPTTSQFTFKATVSTFSGIYWTAIGK